ncbi:MAG: SDR family NAD(P)-dependent oxidoreductase [Lachnospiraceae bacterium]|jgi:3-oxoacyl-[acyl-carrier protein] reductase|nr:SDR family NAD(P)-dependent oxidoreductase [Lachnospiraceae bacterium]
MGCLDGKVAIVTGSGQGIGRGIAIYLAREGARVITNNRSPRSESILKYDKDSMPENEWKEMLSLSGDAEATAELIRMEGGEAIHFYGDVSQNSSARDLVQLAIDTWGRLDILVNNAAGLGSGSIVALNEERWNYLTIPKMRGSFLMMHYAAPHMIKQNFGRIFNCGSSAWTGLADNDAYTAANAGVAGLTWASSKELFRHNITVNVYCPEGSSPGHAVEYNKMLRNIKAATGQDPDPKLLAVVESDHGDPINLGPFIAYLSTEEAGYISGEIFNIKSSGKIARYTQPELTPQIQRPEGAGPLWAVEELKDVFRREVLGEDYTCYAAQGAWGWDIKKK